jgi:hypothetical protein
MEFAVMGGRVIFMPVFTDEVGTLRTELAEGLFDVARQLETQPTAAEAPYWSRSVAVPGLEQVEAELEEASEEAETAEARLAAVRERHDSLAEWRLLLYEDGPMLRTVVAKALRLLGFQQEEGEALTVTSEGEKAFVECEGSREAAVEWPYVRLQRRLEGHLLERSEQLKGIVVANGFRLVAPEEREQQYTDALRIACENYRYCLLTGETLFAMAQRALGGANEAALSGMRRRMLAANGLLTTEMALGEVEQGRDTGPIF